MEMIRTGRIGVDLHRQQTGLPPADLRTFRKILGGNATNVTVPARRLDQMEAVGTSQDRKAYETPRSAGAMVRGGAMFRGRLTHGRGFSALEATF